jgi:hypothetical protein
MGAIIAGIVAAGIFYLWDTEFNNDKPGQRDGFAPRN